MDYFGFKEGELHCEAVPVRRVVETAGTPVYVYSLRTILEHFEKFKGAFRPLDPLICYSVKANSNLSVLRALKQSGSGFDAVSGGEIFRILRAGGEGSDIVFAGVGKTEEEIEMALRAGILLFNVESRGELALIDRVAGDLGLRAQVSFRLNPDVDPHTHRYITTGKRENKFGLDLVTAGELIRDLPNYPRVDLRGLHMHIGSQITRVEPYVRGLERLLAFADEVRASGIELTWMNIGGGYGITYTEKEKPPTVDEYAAAVLPLLRGTPYRLALEPGRFLVGNAGVLLTRVLNVKTSGDKRFVIVDAAMNDLVRPSLYEAFHRIAPVVEGDEPDMSIPADVVGPVCESSDFLARGRYLPPVKEGDLLAVFSAGAYGFTMASNYNSRRRPAEVLVESDSHRVVRARETFEDLVRGEE
jgi:diaminopimelate decarboxylase